MGTLIPRKKKSSQRAFHQNKDLDSFSYVYTRKVITQRAFHQNKDLDCTFKLSLSLRQCLREPSIRTRIQTSIPQTSCPQEISESLPLEQGFRPHSTCAPHPHASQRAFHQNKDLDQKQRRASLPFSGSESLPLEQGFRHLLESQIQIYISQRAFHQNKDLDNNFRQFLYFSPDSQRAFHQNKDLDT